MWQLWSSTLHNFLLSCMWRKAVHFDMFYNLPGGESSVCRYISLIGDVLFKRKVSKCWKGIRDVSRIGTVQSGSPPPPFFASLTRFSLRVVHQRLIRYSLRLIRWNVRHGDARWRRVMKESSRKENVCKNMSAWRGTRKKPNNNPSV